jgi:hypothetical protein
MPKPQLEHALAAQDDVMALVGPAALTVERAEDRVKEAARGVIRLRIGDLRSEIDTLTARAGALRLQLNSLMPTLIDRPWLTPWPTEAAALLDDPEAVLGDEVT